MSLQKKEAPVLNDILQKKSLKSFGRWIIVVVVDHERCDLTATAEWHFRGNPFTNNIDYHPWVGRNRNTCADTKKQTVRNGVPETDSLCLVFFILQGRGMASLTDGIANPKLLLEALVDTEASRERDIV